ncbi:hypothetical protein GTY83_18435 [Streptomyces sp. SID4928]|uniref:DUF6193 family natural product biosynthesis protein n=1 Tax=Streptomyces TaxID=1883 RepID=UPI00020347DE|nr:DUF6193 family natural product biosynthesis protein [Streptomyces sp. ACT-1]EGE43049.1 hypothetical protein SACT1_3714 [Streptomyces sp. ACT-1]MYR51089.1 hypothetical protein [Streptomyces sp. SID4928]
MNRDALQSALSQNGSISARAALAQLETGADFEVFLKRTASAQQLWNIWACRYEIMPDTGVTPRPGLAEAITKPQAAETAPVYMATVLGEPETVKEAVALIAANLPEGCGPAIDGSASDLQPQRQPS